MDLLSSDFTGYRDVQRTNDSVSFGPKTGNLVIDKQSLDNIVRHSKNFKDRTLFLVGKLRHAAFGKNTLVFLKHPLTNRVYFEVSIVKKKVFQRLVEGWMDRYLPYYVYLFLSPLSWSCFLYKKEVNKKEVFSFSKVKKVQYWIFEIKCCV